MGGIIGYLRGHGDHGLLVAAGILCTLLAIGRRNARWRERIAIFAAPLSIAALSLGGIGLISGHHELVWPGVFIFWSLQGFSVETPSLGYAGRQASG
jgi:hypothetical protein